MENEANFTNFSQDQAEITKSKLMLEDISRRLKSEDISKQEINEYSQYLDKLKSYISKYKISKIDDNQKNNHNAVILTEINSLNVDSIENFVLPKEAILLSQLNIIDSLYYLGDNLFTGSAYSLFENKNIGEFKTINEGRLSGPAYAWYEDGTFAMEANYLNGYLAGRFLAWSEVGDLIYDIYFDKGKFQSDLQYERDTSREDQEQDATEGDADSEGNSGE